MIKPMEIHPCQYCGEQCIIAKNKDGWYIDCSKWTCEKQIENVEYFLDPTSAIIAHNKNCTGFEQE